VSKVAGGFQGSVAQVDCEAGKDGGEQVEREAAVRGESEDARECARDD
jgi:hypothetical protein